MVDRNSIEKTKRIGIGRSYNQHSTGKWRDARAVSNDIFTHYIPIKNLPNLGSKIVVSIWKMEHGL